MQSTMSYVMEASESGMPSLTELPSGHDKWCMRRIFVERLRVTAPMGDVRKPGNGATLNGPRVRPQAT